MPLNNEAINQIENTIKDSLRNKFQNYRRESSNMPFHYRLLGRDRMALYSFVQSLNTTFGTSIFEPVAIVIANLNFAIAQKQYIVGDQISEKAQSEIQIIMNDLTIGKTPDKKNEIERIRKVCNSGKMNTLKTVKVDLFIQGLNGSTHMFDLKTAKPNVSNFKDFKRTLLEWIAIYLAKDQNANVNSYIAIPYNPYEPKPYARWTMKGMLDLDNELKVAGQFWDFFGNSEIYTELLDCFERAGIELRPEVDKYFSKFK